MSKYVAQRIPTSAIGGTDWYVTDVHKDGKSGFIKCYCHGEAAAKEIAEALTLKDVIDCIKRGTYHEPRRKKALDDGSDLQR